jgi:hypothetical protein
LPAAAPPAAAIVDVDAARAPAPAGAGLRTSLSLLVLSVIAGLVGALLLGVPALAAAGALALIHALLTMAMLRAGPDGTDAMPALGLAQGGMSLLLALWLMLAAASWSASPAPAALMPSVDGLWLATLIALGGALVSTLAGSRLAAVAGRDHRRRAGAAYWREQALVWLSIALCTAAGWYAGDTPALRRLALVASLLLPALVLLPVAWSALRRWPVALTRTTPPRRFAQVAEQVVIDVLRELPVAQRQLRVGLLAGRAHLHLVAVLDDATDLDAESQDVLRARLFERLRGAYPDLVLDVLFTRDAVWAARSSGGRESLSGA